MLSDQVSGLQAGQTYRLRVSAVNAAGVGMSSVASEPVEAQTKAGQQPANLHNDDLMLILQRDAFNSILRLPPGTKEIEIGVDNDGFIFLGFEAPDSSDKDVFEWSQNYGKAIDAGRARLENKNNRSLVTI
ncbi:hypothetical protein cypCar_00048326 [Cyprinus carpio]|nr:hypothetical protein cypCar_00048326 [Cyprinus carpio]